MGQCFGVSQKISVVVNKVRLRERKGAKVFQALSQNTLRTGQTNKDG